MNQSDLDIGLFAFRGQLDRHAGKPSVWLQGPEDAVGCLVLWIRDHPDRSFDLGPLQPVQRATAFTPLTRHYGKRRE